MAFQKDSVLSIMYMGKIVGEGLLKRMGPKSRIQGIQLPKECYGVQVKFVNPEPVPLFHRLPKNEEITTLQQAVGKIVAWPIQGLVMSSYLNIYSIDGIFVGKNCPCYFLVVDAKRGGVYSSFQRGTKCGQ